MERPISHINLQNPELLKNVFKRKVVTFFKGCNLRKCFSPHCPNYIGKKNLSQLREDPENNIQAILEMIEKNELQIYCHQASVAPPISLSQDLDQFHPIFCFSFLQTINLDSATRFEIFLKIKQVVDNSFIKEPIEQKEEIIKAFETCIQFELLGLETVINQGIKDYDLFETLCYFFTSFSFIFEIENFQHLNVLKNLLVKLSLPACYHIDFKQGVRTSNFTYFVNRIALERINENLQNLLALQIAEEVNMLKIKPEQAHNLSAISSSIAFTYNLNSFLFLNFQINPKEFINEALHLECDIKTSTLLYIRETLQSRSNNSLSRTLMSLANTSNFNCLNYPFLLPLELKVDALYFESKILQSVEMQNSLSQIDNPWMLLFNGNDFYLELNLRRDNLVEDALNQLAGKSKGSILRRGLKIKFEGEPGVDEGGLTKEFFQLLTQQLFDLSFGMFIEKNDRFLWFDSKSFECSINFELVGTLLGLALYNETILPLKFPMAVYKKLKKASSESYSLADEIDLEDLKELEPQIYTTLNNILKTDWTNQETGMTFSVSYDFFGEVVNYNLVKGGSDIEVTEQNKIEFVDRYIHWYLTESVQNQFEPFCKGFYNVLSKRTLALFNAEDLYLAICGNDALDFKALKRTTKYEDFLETSETIQYFWQILDNDFNLDQKKAFLKFLTGSDRAPLKGLGDIKMTITRYGPNSEHLPASHTCFNHLLLPDYKDYQKLKAKLLKAVENCEGFGLF